VKRIATDRLFLALCCSLALSCSEYKRAEQPWEAGALVDAGGEKQIVSPMTDATVDQLQPLLDGTADKGITPDSAVPDGATLDSAATLDGNLADSGVKGPPCVGSTGTALWRVRWSTPMSWSIVADALPTLNNWTAQPVQPGSSLIDGKAVLLKSNSFILFRWDWSGIAGYKSAQLCARAKTHGGGKNNGFYAWSPFHGTSATSSVFDFKGYVYQCVDFTAMMSVADPPGNVGFRLYPDSAGADLAMEEVELCLQGLTFK